MDLKTAQESLGYSVIYTGGARGRSKIEKGVIMHVNDNYAFVLFSKPSYAIATFPEDLELDL